MRIVALIILMCCPILLAAEPPTIKDIQRQRADVKALSSIAMHGTPALEGSWSHFPYVNPKAPKGGEIRLSAIGTFDSLNQFISKGTAASGLELAYDRLMEPALDEPFSMYGLVAKTIQIDPEGYWVIFAIDDQAQFHDGHNIDSEDIVFTFNTLVEKGEPLYQLQYLDVLDAHALNKREVLFRFKHQHNRELPLILGQLPVLPAHYWTDKIFDEPTLTPPLSSGPYKMTTIKPGKTLSLERAPDYWAKDHPTKVGRHNFHTWRFEYFSESNIALEAFKSGEYTFRPENNSKFWATSYTGDQFDSGAIKTAEVAVQKPVGMQGFVYNTRKAVFQDPILREALAYAFNFEWSNQNLFYGQYKRTRSFFENTDLAASGTPSEAELALLEPLKKHIPPRALTDEYQPPVTDDKGIRTNLRTALGLLKKAGYELKNKQLHTPDGTPVSFEILLYDTGFERIVLPFIQNLETLGVKAEPRRVDVNQYIERLRSFEFDMIVTTFPQSLSPGNEQRNYWHSSAADQRDSRNFSGIKNPAVDALIETIITANDRESLVIASRALDRVLQWSFIVIPNWHVNYERLAYWPPITMPEKHPRYNVDLQSWWSAP